MQYELRLMDTQAGVGCFEAQPKPNLSLHEMLDHAAESPLDDFMHHLLLRRMGELPNRKVRQLIRDVTEGDKRGDHVLGALLAEACRVHMRLTDYLPLLDGLDMDALLAHTPTLHLRSALLPDQPLHREWAALFAAHNIDHAPLPRPEDAPPLPYAEDELRQPDWTPLAEVRARLEGALPPAKPRRPVEQTTALALEALERVGAPLTPEMAHRASLAPFGLLRHWKTSLSVSLGRNRHSFEGMQTCYGRGIGLDQARVSMLMEMAERYSAYASFGRNGLLGRNRPCPLVRGSLAGLSKERACLPLGSLRLEAPYAGQELYWMEGERPDGKGGTEPVLIPPQLVFLFCNLDEPSLFSAMGSTGLASGNTLAEAKVAALCEVLERDAIAVTPLDVAAHKGCFTVTSADPVLGRLLAAYAEHGVHVWFQDLTGGLGIPCYRAFLIGEQGDVNVATGCGLDGARALVSAMTEMPFPFPGPRTAPAPAGLPVRALEELPGLSSGSAEGDLLLLEAVLMENGLQPHYADITRGDLNIPVVRAMVPGLELMYDFDQFSRLSPRLFANYLGLFA
jgi:ribosomal protein S12 methylthiotransferase accessory factor YcaO